MAVKLGKRLMNLINYIHTLQWPFPPRPSTHHVRWIEPDVNRKEYLFVAIEAGALIKSFDGGKTWID